MNQVQGLGTQLKFISVTVRRLYANARGVWGWVTNSFKHTQGSESKASCPRLQASLIRRKSCGELALIHALSEHKRSMWQGRNVNKS